MTEHFSAASTTVTAQRGLTELLERPTLTDPLSHPEVAGNLDRTKRAWTLLLLTLVLPGSAQLVSGNRRIGRSALKVTLGAWVAVLLFTVLYLLHRPWAIGLFTGQFTSLVLIMLFIALAIGWAVLFLDTLRLIRLPLLAEGMRPAVALGCAGLMLLTSGVLGYGAYMVGVSRSALGSIFAGGPAFDPVNGRYNFLLMGGDAGADRVGRRPDSMTVFSIDAKTGQAVTISLPRNTQNAPFAEDSPLWQVYPEGFSCGNECILNALYTDVTQNHADLYPDAEDPGAQAMKDAAEGITGLPIQAYVLVDMGGFSDLIDAMGGITIDVGGRVPIGGGTNEITGEPNPIDGYIEPGVQTLDGFHALWYARSREGASDFEREARQRCVQSAMLAQLDPATVVTHFQSITKAGEQIIETDIPMDQLASFVDLALKAKKHELIGYAMAPPYYGDLFPTYPNYDRFRQDVAEVIQNSEEGVAPTVPAEPPQAAEQRSSAAEQPRILPAGQVQPAGQIQALPGTPAGQSGVVLAEELSPNGICSVP